MNTKERIKELAARRRLTLAELERKLNISNGTIGKWDTRKPNSEPLEKVADFFDVSTDYLLGRSENPSPDVGRELEWDDMIVKDEDEEDLLTAFRLESEDMTEEEKKKFNNSLKGMMKIAKGLLDDDSNWKE